MPPFYRRRLGRIPGIGRQLPPYFILYKARPDVTMLIFMAVEGRRCPMPSQAMRIFFLMRANGK
jgi:hypothetical protein